jgi:CHAT domain-containing protein
MAGGNKGWKDGTDEGVLTAYEILQMDLSNTDLVILAACVTGLGDIDPYEGVFGLQRAFKIAGVDKIIMSLWSVKDFYTKQFFDIFYANLRNQQSIRESFYNAQSSMRTKYKNRPDLWGGFILLE